MADIRIAKKSARYGFVFARRGIVPDGCASWFLPKLVGISKSLELCYSGDLISAEEGSKIGLINYLIDDEENIIDVAIELAKKINILKESGLI